ncbi:Alpha-D-kanosaminyltransferase [Planctomycetes bacterium Poly30]|uniref:Alpha-D-kanosaminyltransferase n=1 Tax=Saltatorellus ferox TaxID=2528018 RepID=A0A518ERT7_9BACT|nr:Alpha-D-kanosaminyltransferase [Planctomycetes bacterium Poly30]
MQSPEAHGGTTSSGPGRINLGPDPRLVLVANARMPSQRAQSGQLARAARAFQRAGVATTVLHAKRRDTAAVPASVVWQKLLMDHDPNESAPELVAAPCSDWIDTVPRFAQFLPARLQEWTFGRSAARIVRRDFRGALCLARDVEVGHWLRGRPGLALEIHRVPGGETRRRWLLGAVEAGAQVVAISGGVRDDLIALGVPERRICVEHDAIDAGLGDRLPTREEARRALGIDASRPVVLYAGGLLRWKGVDGLVDAAGRLDDALVLIVGGMEADIGALRERAAGMGNVRIDGFQEAARIPTYLAAADVGVVPNRRTPRISSHYTSPLKVFEAMAAGLPLVVSDLPSLRDAVGPTGAAVFVEPEDPAALAAGISGLLDDPAARSSLAERARAAVQGCTWEARAHRILAFMAHESQVHPTP